MNRHTLGVLLVLIASAGFGTLAIFGKFAEQAGLNTITLLTYRYILGTLIMWAGLVLWGRLRSLGGRKLLIALALGFLQAGFAGLFFWGVLYIPAGVAALAFYTYPIYVYVISMLFLNETINGRKLIALVLALVGVGLIVGGDGAGVNLVGVGLILMASLGYALYITGSRAALGSIEPDVLAGYAMIGSSFSCLAFGLFSGQLFVPGGGEQWMIIAGIAVVGTAVPIFLYILGLEWIEASHASIVGTSEPLMTVLLGIVLLGEVLTLSVTLGGGLVLLGVVLIQTDARRQVQPPMSEQRGTVAD